MFLYVMDRMIMDTVALVPLLCVIVCMCFEMQVYDNVNAQRRAEKRNEEKRKQE